MTLKKNNYLLSVLLLGGLLMLNLPAYALTGDTEQPINIDSLHQSLDMNTNTATFSGNVVIKQGSINIQADKVIIIRSKTEKGKDRFEAYGNPVKFSQLQDDGKLVKGHSQKMTYELDIERLTLTKNAYLEQMDSNIKGDKITYLVRQQQLDATSNQGNRVKTVLMPSQIQNKSSTTKPASTKKP